MQLTTTAHGAAARHRRAPAIPTEDVPCMTKLGRQDQSAITNVCVMKPLQFDEASNTKPPTDSNSRASSPPALGGCACSPLRPWHDVDVVCAEQAAPHCCLALLQHCVQLGGLRTLSASLWEWSVFVCAAAAAGVNWNRCREGKLLLLAQCVSDTCDRVQRWAACRTTTHCIPIVQSMCGQKDVKQNRMVCIAILLLPTG